MPASLFLSSTWSKLRSRPLSPSLSLLACWAHSFEQQTFLENKNNAIITISITPLVYSNHSSSLPLTHSMLLELINRLTFVLCVQHKTDNISPTLPSSYATCHGVQYIVVFMSCVNHYFLLTSTLPRPFKTPLSFLPLQLTHYSLRAHASLARTPASSSSPENGDINTFYIACATLKFFTLSFTLRRSLPSLPYLPYPLHL